MVAVSRLASRAGVPTVRADATELADPRSGLAGADPRAAGYLA